MSKASILIVEDEAIVAADLANKLGQLGYAICGTTARGEEAVAFVRDRRPDLVLMDIRLAGPLDGVAAAERIRRECEVPVIYLTALSDRATLERAKLTEPFGYLLKPFQELEVQAHIEVALYKHQAERKLARMQEELRAANEELAAGNEELRATNEELAASNEQLQTVTQRLKDNAEQLEATTEELRVSNETLEARVTQRTAQLHALNEQLQQEVQERRRLEGRLLDASEREQRRLGQELHDDVCSQLTGIEFLAHALARDLAADSEAAARPARRIARLLQDAMADARKLAHGLSPLPLDAHGLSLGLQDLAARTRKIYHCRCSFRGDRLLKVADLAKALHLYRIAQEAVTNAVKHGRAQTIGISLVAQGDTVILRVSDYGCGLATDAARGLGLGLLTMESRAAAMGGSLVVQRNRHGGTDVVCTVPGGLRLSKERKTP